MEASLIKSWPNLGATWPQLGTNMLVHSTPPQKKLSTPLGKHYVFERTTQISSTNRTFPDCHFSLVLAARHSKKPSVFVGGAELEEGGREISETVRFH